MASNPSPPCSFVRDSSAAREGKPHGRRSIGEEVPFSDRDRNHPLRNFPDLAPVDSVTAISDSRGRTDIDNDSGE
ncbi:unnamed protein product [Linum tenue]|uniref:Uncharacterized protein n=1 Tax=Linum tenue TaxID=586396 RepID=A0AAV0S042_9ROSI|nr:unnamed protein product [Linum tenue]